MKKRICLVKVILVLASTDVVGQTVVVNSGLEFVQEELDWFSKPTNHRATIALGEPPTTWFDYDGSHIEAVTWTLDFAGADWYVVSPGDSFGVASIARNQFPVIRQADSSGGPVFIGNGEVYLGFATFGPLPSSPYTRTVFGWVHLIGEQLFAPQNFDPNDPSTWFTGRLRMVQNAIAYDSRGIVVGTTDAVPEPTCGGLAFLTLAIVSSVFRRTRRLG